MTLKTQMITDLDNSYSELGESVSYNGSSVLAFPEYVGEAEEEPSGDVAEATIRVRVSEVPQWSYRDTIVIESETWVVQRKGNRRSHDQLEWILTLRRDHRPTMRK